MTDESRTDLRTEAARSHEREIARIDREIDLLKVKHAFLEASQMEMKEELRADFRAVKTDFKEALQKLDEKIENSLRGIAASVAAISANLTWAVRVVLGAVILGVVAFLFKSGAVIG